MLSQALREMERQRAREKLRDEKGTDVHYLKNVILKMFETGARHASPHHTAQHVKFQKLMRQPRSQVASMESLSKCIHGKPSEVL